MFFCCFVFICYFSVGVVAETRYNMINTSDIKNNTIRLVISATKKVIKKNLVEKKSRLRLFYEIIYADCGCHEYPEP